MSTPETDAALPAAFTTTGSLLTMGPFPQISWSDPTTADLIAVIEHMHAVAHGVDLHAKPFAMNNPWATLGALQSHIETLKTLLLARQRGEERSLMLMDRLAHEARDEPVTARFETHDADTGIALYGEI